MKTAICIASGPSLTRDDVNAVRGHGRVYVVKECCHLSPWADVLYAADTDWWQNNAGCPYFEGEKWTVSHEAATQFCLNHINYRNDIPWSNEQGLIASGGNSGFQAINLAALDLIRLYPDEPKRIILLGYDMGYIKGQDKHWWDQELPRESRYSNYADWLKRMAAAVPYIPLDIQILNASRQTAINCFPQVNLGDVL